MISLKIPNISKSNTGLYNTSYGSASYYPQGTYGTAGYVDDMNQQAASGWGGWNTGFNYSPESYGSIAGWGTGTGTGTGLVSTVGNIANAANGFSTADTVSKVANAVSGVAGNNSGNSWFNSGTFNNISSGLANLGKLASGFLQGYIGLKSLGDAEKQYANSVDAYNNANYNNILLANTARKAADSVAAAQSGHSDDYYTRNAKAIADAELKYTPISGGTTTSSNTTVS